MGIINQLHFYLGGTIPEIQLVKRLGREFSQISASNYGCKETLNTGCEYFMAPKCNLIAIL